MLCIWWHWKGIIYYELVPDNQTINSKKYCLQIGSKIEICKKCLELINRKGVVFYHDNVKSHTNLTQQKLLEFSWDVLPHLPYSPDIFVPSDYHLFRSLQNFIKFWNLFLWNASKTIWTASLPKKNQDFYERGILKLPERWKSIVQNNGAYIID